MTKIIKQDLSHLVWRKVGIFIKISGSLPG